MPKQPPVLTVPEVAAMKRVSQQAVRGAVARGTLTAYRAGRDVLVLRDRKLEAYLAVPPQPGRRNADPSH